MENRHPNLQRTPLLLVAFCLVVFLLSAGEASAAASPDGEAREDSATTPQPTRRAPSYIPARILHRAANGSDSLAVVTDPLFGEPVSLLTVTGASEVAEFLRLIETPAIELGGSTSHGCDGFHHIRLFRKGQLAAEFSFDHVSLLRPYSTNLWEGGDVDLTKSSARALAAWFYRHGLSDYQQEIDRLDAETARWKAFHAVFPVAVVRFLKKAHLGNQGPDAPPVDCRPASVEPLRSAVPDPGERAKLLFRALGNLKSDWSSYDDEEGTVLLWAHCIPVEVLISTIDGIQGDRIALRGAARVFFGRYPGGRGLVRTIERSAGERLAASLAPQIFIENDIRNAPLLPLVLSDLRSKEIDRVLQEAASRMDAIRDHSCSNLDHASAPLSSLVVLAERRRVENQTLQSLLGREWQCKADSAAVRAAEALANDRLPEADDLSGSDLTTGLMVLRRLKERTTKEAIDLALAGLLETPWGIVRGEVEEWLGRLSNVAVPAANGMSYGEFQHEHHARLRSWWAKARSGWNRDGGVP